MSKTCQSCAHWFLGTVEHYNDDATQWDGKPHPYAGEDVIVTPWNERKRFPRDHKLGRCMNPVAGKNLDKDQATSHSFGCVQYDKNVFGHFEYHTITCRHDKTVEEHVREVRESADIEELKIDLSGAKIGSDGWVFIPVDPSDLETTAKINPEWKQ